jgi:hypothetical protein
MISRMTLGIPHSLPSMWSENSGVKGRKWPVGCAVSSVRTGLSNTTRRPDPMSCIFEIEPPIRF